ncbi:MAG: guanylate kinase [Rhodomicrobium sp.]|nr:MAG: guanylate kinase [Rhodomicrobium sp.]
MNNHKKNSDKVERRGLMFVLSSPSGAGKTSLAKAIMANDNEISMSISMTTRKPRPGEINGKDYHFVDMASFDEALKAGTLLEWAEVFGNHYGTPKAPVDEELKQGRDVLFDIDWQGTQQLREKAGADVVRVFILPPSVKALEDRLKTRGTDDEEVVRARMKQAINQISHWAEYDYVVVNETIDESLKELTHILMAERLKRERRIGLSTMVRDLTSEM